MRKYCIAAVLLDQHDPSKVIDHLGEPLLSPAGEERESHGPNVFYSCDFLLHGEKIILPYAISDKFTSIASVELAALLAALMHKQSHS